MFVNEEKNICLVSCMQQQKQKKKQKRKQNNGNNKTIMNAAVAVIVASGLCNYGKEDIYCCLSCLSAVAIVGGVLVAVLLVAVQ